MSSKIRMDSAGADDHHRSGTGWNISEQTGSTGADKKDMYCTGTEVTAPRLHRRVYVPYPENVPAREVQGIAVLAMVIDASGIPAHI